MIEELQLGSVVCHFLRMDEFLALCRKWLAVDSLHHVVTLNPEMVLLAEQDSAFRTAVARADLKVPDGSGLVWARWFLRSQFWSLWPSLLAFPFVHVERIPGVDSLLKIAELAAQEHKSVYLLGGTSSQVRRTATLLQKRYPDLVVYTSPDHAFDIEGPPSVLADITAKQPAVLFVAYGAPKQTVWIERHRSALTSVRIAVGVGGAFAILSEERTRAPYVLRRLNLEWLWRLLLEPARLPRIWRATIQFPLLINRHKKVQVPPY